MRVVIVTAWLVVVIALQSVLHSTPAAAHTGFDSSEPADGDQLSGPVGEVVITFTGEAEPTGEGFVALDPTRGVRNPDEVVARGGSEWLLRFDPPLSGGEVAIRWTVKAPDAHAISGGFSFTVTAQAVFQDTAPDPIPEATPDADDQSGSEPATGAVSDSATVAVGDSNDPDEALVGQSQDGTPPAAGPEPSDADSGTAGVGDNRNAGENTLVSRVVEVDSAADFATAGVERLGNAELVANLGRGLAYAGTVLAIGALVFAVFVLDRQGDIVAVARWAGTCGLIVVCGAALEVMAQIYLEHGRWSFSNLLEIAETELGYSAGLRAMGGALLWALPMPRFKWRHDADGPAAVRFGSQPPLQPVSAPMSGGQPGSLSAVSTKPVAPDAVEAVVEANAAPPSVAWRFGSAAVVAIIASMMLATSHIFDGHTLSRGNRIIMSLAAISHVAAAGAWAGGVVALALTLVRRRRRPPVNGAKLGARFSVVAAAGLVVVGVVGVALTAMILDSPSQLWTTDWGRLLLVKVALVGAGAALGGYNHFVLLPRMGARAMADGTVPSPRIGFSTVVAIEAGLLIAVAVLSGILVGAAL
jgi:copper transport protein